MAAFSVTIEVTESGRKAPQWSLDNDLNGQATLAEILAFTKESLIVISDTALKEEQARGFDRKPRLLVDNSSSKQVSQVSPLGSIEYVARQSARSILMFAYKAILERSKVVTGEYLRSNVVTYNGFQVATDMASFEVWLAANENFRDEDIVRFVNTAPYARKLERFGVTAQRTRAKVVKKDKRRNTVFRNTMQVPNGVYALAYRAIKGKFKANSSVRFEILPGNLLGIGSGFDGKRRVFANGHGKGRPYLYPTISIKLAEIGSTDVVGGLQ